MSDVLEAFTEFDLNRDAYTADEIRRVGVRISAGGARIRLYHNDLANEFDGLA